MSIQIRADTLSILAQKNPASFAKKLAGTWRKRWDSNPRGLSPNLISSQGRYDHFDTLPYTRIAFGQKLLYHARARTVKPFAHFLQHTIHRACSANAPPRKPTLLAPRRICHSYPHNSFRAAWQRSPCSLYPCILYLMRHLHPHPFPLRHLSPPHFTISAHSQTRKGLARCQGRSSCIAGSLSRLSLLSQWLTHSQAIYTSILSPSVSKHGITSLALCVRPLSRMNSISVL